MNSKLQLPTVTLIIVDCIDAERANNVLAICKSKADFGAVKLLTHLPIESEHRVEIQPLTTLVMYSIFMLTKFSEYIDTPNVLIVQADGFILNPDSFDMSWLNLDFIGPLFMQFDRVGSGGFSLRSKHIMDYSSQIMPKWDGTLEHANEIQSSLGYYEDGVLCFDSRFKHFKFATPEQACMFAQGGNRNPKYHRSNSFGFHRTFQKIDFNTGFIDSSDLNADITQGYGNEINELIKKI